MFGLFFTGGDRRSTSYAEAMTCDVERFKKFFHGMLDEGVYLAPSAFEAGFVSAAHTRRRHRRHRCGSCTGVCKALRNL